MEVLGIDVGGTNTAFGFVDIEEEASVTAILDKLKLVGANNMYIFDRDIVSMRKSTTE